MLYSSGISFRFEVTLGHIKRSHGYIVMVYHIYTAFLYQLVLCCIIYITGSFITRICLQQRYVKRYRLDLKYYPGIQFLWRGDDANKTMKTLIKTSPIIQIIRSTWGISNHLRLQYKLNDIDDSDLTKYQSINLTNKISKTHFIRWT